jgi:hypothetical protein
MKNKKLPPIHPGEILMEEFLEPMGISQYRLAKDISVPPQAHKRDCAWEKIHYRRYRASFGTVFWHVASVLVKPPDAL